VTTPLEHLAERLQDAARELGDPGTADERASALVEEIARLAGEAGAELDRRVRATRTDP
jgi:hypothetical protein